MRIDVLTLFPEVLEPFFQASIVGRAVAAGLVEIACTNYRDFTHDKHRSVDDKPFGGGPGMVMMCQPLHDCVQAVEKMNDTPARRILLSPQWDLREDEFRAVRLRVIRIFPDFELTLQVRHDEIKNDTTFAASIDLVEF